MVAAGKDTSQPYELPHLLKDQLRTGCPATFPIQAHFSNNSGKETRRSVTMYFHIRLFPDPQTFTSSSSIEPVEILNGNLFS